MFTLRWVISEGQSYTYNQVSDDWFVVMIMHDSMRGESYKEVEKSAKL